MRLTLFSHCEAEILLPIQFLGKVALSLLKLIDMSSVLLLFPRWSKIRSTSKLWGGIRHVVVLLLVSQAYELIFVLGLLHVSKYRTPNIRLASLSVAVAIWDLLICKIRLVCIITIKKQIVFSSRSIYGSLKFNPRLITDVRRLTHKWMEVGV